MRVLRLWRGTPTAGIDFPRMRLPDELLRLGHFDNPHEESLGRVLADEPRSSRTSWLVRERSFDCHLDVFEGSVCLCQCGTCVRAGQSNLHRPVDAVDIEQLMIM